LGIGQVAITGNAFLQGNAIEFYGVADSVVSNNMFTGLSPRTVAYIRTVLRIALNRALKWGLVARNVAALTDPPRQERTERQPLTPEQARTFLKAVEGDRLEALYRVGLALGLRLGEALGLRWEDVDLDTGTLRIRA
jgi:integrase